MIPHYPYTNESLDAVVKGLDVQSSDDIIGVLGSGDQAFAMIEYANSVLAVDNNKVQVAYAQERKAMLREGNIERFLHPECLPEITGKYKGHMDSIVDYFSQPGRLERIRQKLDLLEIKKTANVLDKMKEGRFSKAYLSNIIGFNGFMIKPNAQKAFVKELANRLRMPGLIYFTSTSWLRLEKMHEIENDKALTIAARQEEDKLYSGEYASGWRVLVYRRTA
ncbi:MAG: hypothetical protein WC852_04680 [Candidatus Nanoarchaeia archaeon]|jgi:hypothetical protein